MYLSEENSIHIRTYFIYLFFSYFLILLPLIINYKCSLEIEGPMYVWVGIEKTSEPAEPAEVFGLISGKFPYCMMFFQVINYGPNALKVTPANGYF